MRDVITFEGKCVVELKKSFRDSIEDYLAFCAERGEEPDKSFSGQFVTRVSPELHRRASLAGKSLNARVAEKLQSDVESGGIRKKTRSRKNERGALRYPQRFWYYSR